MGGDLSQVGGGPRDLLSDLVYMHFLISSEAPLGSQGTAEICGFLCIHVDAKQSVASVE